MTVAAWRVGLVVAGVLYVALLTRLVLTTPRDDRQRGSWWLFASITAETVALVLYEANRLAAHARPNWSALVFVTVGEACGLTSCAFFLRLRRDGGGIRSDVRPVARTSSGRQSEAMRRKRHTYALRYIAVVVTVLLIMQLADILHG